MSPFFGTGLSASECRYVQEYELRRRNRLGQDYNYLQYETISITPRERLEIAIWDREWDNYWRNTALASASGAIFGCATGAAATIAAGGVGCAPAALLGIAGGPVVAGMVQLYEIGTGNIGPNRNPYADHGF